MEIGFLGRAIDAFVPVSRTPTFRSYFLGKDCVGFYSLMCEDCAAVSHGNDCGVLRVSQACYALTTHFFGERGNALPLTALASSY